MAGQPPGFWEAIPTFVVSKVQLGLKRGPKAREPLIEYLRDLEAVARGETTCRDAVQVIASGRRLLGDGTEVGEAMHHTIETALGKAA